MRRALAALAVAGLFGSPVAAEAAGRSPAAAQSISAPLELHPSLVARALRDIGRGNFTRFREAWCADAVSAWLTAVGLRPLSGHMAASALAYGPRLSAPRPGDLAVIRTRRGVYGHVGIVIADLGSSVEIVSGNWGGRVARARVARREVVAFVGV